MSIRKARKLGFFAALAILIGSVVGIGIFLKNHSILDANSWSGSGALVSWIIGGVLSLAAAVSFSEIASFKNGKVAGLADWAEKVGGKKFGYLVRFSFPVFYFIFLNTSISFFASESIISIVIGIMDVPMPHMGYVFGVAVVLFLFFTVLNFMSLRASGNFAKVTVVLKFIPLVLVAVLGIVMATTNNSPTNVAGPDFKPGDRIYGHNAFTNGRSFDFTKMLAALPAVLFAYDAFLIVASLRKKMDKPEKLPKVVVVGMITVVILYLLITIAALLHGAGMVSGKAVGAPAFVGLGIFDQIFSGSAAKGMGIFVIVFIAISILGVQNGVTAATMATFEQLVETDTLFGSKAIKAKLGDKAGAVTFAGFTTIAFLIYGIPSTVLNSDAIVDGISNFPTLFFFAIYGIVIFLYTIKRSTFDTKKMNNTLFHIAAWTSILGIGFVIAYQLFYGMTTNLIMNGSTDASSGLFADHGIKISQLTLSITFFSMLGIFFGGAGLNALLISKVEKRTPFFSTQDVADKARN